MKSRYDRAPGKDARMANVRGKRFEGEHSSANSFVKSEEAKIKSKAGRDPKLEAKDMEFNAEMMNNGAHAQRLASALTSSIDHEAFPVRKPSSE